MTADGILEKIEQEAEIILQQKGMELVEVQFRRERPGWVLRLFIDKEGGVDINDCAEVSGLIGDMIEDKALIEHSYTLEVSSPGLDRPLRKRSDFERFKGRLVKVRTKEPLHGSRLFRGELIGLKDEMVCILQANGKGTIHIPLEDISIARLDFKFPDPGKAPKA